MARKRKRTRVKNLGTRDHVWPGRSEDERAPPEARQSGPLVRPLGWADIPPMEVLYTTDELLQICGVVRAEIDRFAEHSILGGEEGEAEAEQGAATPSNHREERRAPME